VKKWWKKWCYPIIIHQVRENFSIGAWDQGENPPPLQTLFVIGKYTQVLLKLQRSKIFTVARVAKLLALSPARPRREHLCALLPRARALRRLRHRDVEVAARA